MDICFAICRYARGRRASVKAAEPVRQIALCALMGFAVNASADNAQYIASLKAECPKVSLRQDQRGISGAYNGAVSNSVGYFILGLGEFNVEGLEEYDPKLVKLVKELLRPEFQSYANNILKADAQNGMSSFSHLVKIKDVDQDFIKDSLLCYTVKAYTDIESNENQQVVYNLERVLALAKSNADPERRAEEQAETKLRQVADQARIKKERDDKERFLNPKNNSAKVGEFQVTANGCSATQKIVTANPFFEPKPWPESKFLVVDISYKNVSTASRYLPPGNIVISKNGTVYKFDKFEVIPENGYGIRPEPLNPLVTYRTKLVYRIPNDLAGKIVWQANGGASNVTLLCGSI